jgi:MFS family permease
MSIAVATDIAAVIGKKVGMGFWMGIFNTTISVGTIAAPLVAGVVMDYAGINSVFYFAGILSLVFTFTGCFYVWNWSKVNKRV